jgi:hypothetical protein
MPAQYVADGWRDLSLGQDPGRDLVQQWLEQVVVPAVDEGYLDVRPLEEPGCEQAAKAASDNDYPVRTGLAHFSPSELPNSGCHATGMVPQPFQSPRSGPSGPAGIIRYG